MKKYGIARHDMYLELILSNSITKFIKIVRIRILTSSLRSWPEEKTGPSPLRMITRRSWESTSVSISSLSAVSIAKDSAFLQVHTVADLEGG